MYKGRGPLSVFRDALIIFRYQLRLSLREPVWIIVVMIQPLLYLSLFRPLLAPLTKTKGFPQGDAWQVYVPGLLIQLSIFGSWFVGFNIVTDLRNGSIERTRLTPASGLGLLLGRVLRDTLVLVTQATLLTVIAIAFGLRAEPLGIAISLGVVGLLGIALSSGSYAIGLWLKSESALAPLLNMATPPVLLLSGILLPMTLAPQWLQHLSQVNPFSHIVDCTRAAFRGEFDDPALVVGVVCAAMLAAIGLWAAERNLRRTAE
jgi:ABC-2 type transport system permease protein